MMLPLGPLWVRKGPTRTGRSDRGESADRWAGMCHLETFPSAILPELLGLEGSGRLRLSQNIR